MTADQTNNGADPLPDVRDVSTLLTPPPAGFTRYSSPEKLPTRDNLIGAANTATTLEQLGNVERWFQLVQPNLAREASQSIWDAITQARQKYNTAFPDISEVSTLLSAPPVDMGVSADTVETLLTQYKLITAMRKAETMKELENVESWFHLASEQLPREECEIIDTGLTRMRRLTNAYERLERELRADPSILEGASSIEQLRNLLMNRVGNNVKPVELTGLYSRFSKFVLQCPKLSVRKSFHSIPVIEERANLLSRYSFEDYQRDTSVILKDYQPPREEYDSLLREMWMELLPDLVRELSEGLNTNDYFALLKDIDVEKIVDSFHRTVGVSLSVDLLNQHFAAVRSLLVAEMPAEMLADKIVSEIEHAKAENLIRLLGQFRDKGYLGLVVEFVGDAAVNIDPNLVSEKNFGALLEDRIVVAFAHQLDEISHLEVDELADIRLLDNAGEQVTRIHQLLDRHYEGDYHLHHQYTEYKADVVILQYLRAIDYQSEIDELSDALLGIGLSDLAAVHGPADLVRYGQNHFPANLAQRIGRLAPHAWRELSSFFQHCQALQSLDGLVSSATGIEDYEACMREQSRLTQARQEQKLPYTEAEDTVYKRISNLYVSLLRPYEEKLRAASGLRQVREIMVEAGVSLADIADLESDSRGLRQQITREISERREYLVGTYAAECSRLHSDFDSGEDPAIPLPQAVATERKEVSELHSLGVLSDLEVSNLLEHLNNQVGIYASRMVKLLVDTTGSHSDNRLRGLHEMMQKFLANMAIPSGPDFSEVAGLIDGYMQAYHRRQIAVVRHEILRGTFILDPSSRIDSWFWEVNDLPSLNTVSARLAAFKEKNGAYVQPGLLDDVEAGVNTRVLELINTLPARVSAAENLSALNVTVRTILEEISLPLLGHEMRAEAVKHLREWAPQIFRSLGAEQLKQQVGNFNAFTETEEIIRAHVALSDTLGPELAPGFASSVTTFMTGRIWGLRAKLLPGLLLDGMLEHLKLVSVLDPIPLDEMADQAAVKFANPYGPKTVLKIIYQQDWDHPATSSELRGQTVREIYAELNRQVRELEKARDVVVSKIDSVNMWTRMDEFNETCGIHLKLLDLLAAEMDGFNQMNTRLIMVFEGLLRGRKHEQEQRLLRDAVRTFTTRPAWIGSADTIAKMGNLSMKEDGKRATFISLLLQKGFTEAQRDRVIAEIDAAIAEQASQLIRQAADQYFDRIEASLAGMDWQTSLQWQTQPSWEAYRKELVDYGFDDDQVASVAQTIGDRVVKVMSEEFVNDYLISLGISGDLINAQQVSLLKDYDRWTSYTQKLAESGVTVDQIGTVREQYELRSVSLVNRWLETLSIQAGLTITTVEDFEQQLKEADVTDPAAWSLLSYLKRQLEERQPDADNADAFSLTEERMQHVLQTLVEVSGG